MKIELRGAIETASIYYICTLMPSVMNVEYRENLGYPWNKEQQRFILSTPNLGLSLE